MSTVSTSNTPVDGVELAEPAFWRRPEPDRLASDQQDGALAALVTQPARAVGGGEPPTDQQMIDLARRHGPPTRPFVP